MQPQGSENGAATPQILFYLLSLHENCDIISIYKIIGSGSLTWIINVTVVLLCPNSVWPTAVWFILTLDTKLRSLSWHDLCFTGMVLLTKEGIIFYWPVESHNVLLSRVVWIATVFGILFIREIQFVLSLSNIGWSGMWVSEKVYGLVYVYWNPLSVGVLAFWFLFRSIVFRSMFAPYWCLQISFMWYIFALIHDFSRETSPPSLQNRSAY